MFATTITVRRALLVLSLSAALGAGQVFVPSAVGAEQQQQTGGSNGRLHPALERLARSFSPETLPNDWRTLAANNTTKGMSTSSFNVKDYKASLSILSLGSQTFVSINYTKRNNTHRRSAGVGSLDQVTHAESVNIGGDSFRQSSDLKTGSIDTGAAFGPQGRIDANFKAKKGKKGRKRGKKKKCTSNQSRSGRLSGTIRYDAGGYLGEFELDGVDAISYSHTSFDKPGCNEPPPPPPCDNYVSLNTAEGAQFEGGFFYAAHDLKTNRVIQQFFLQRTQGSISISDSIIANGPPSSFTFSNDLTSAGITGIGPFFGGSGTFTSETVGEPEPDPGCGSTQFAFGSFTGDLTARFDQIPDVIINNDLQEESANLSRVTPN